MMRCFRYLMIPLLFLYVGCASPKGNFGSMEYLRDERDFSTITVYGGREFPGKIKTFGFLDLNSGRSGQSSDDLTAFYGEFKTRRELSHGIGIAAEYNDSSGDDNDVVRAGFFCDIKSPIIKQLRFYPLAAGSGEQISISLGENIGNGNVKPYIDGFVDINRSTDGTFSTAGEVQVGAKLESGFRAFFEFRYFDSDRRNGLKNPALAGGIGWDF